MTGKRKNFSSILIMAFLLFFLLLQNGVCTEWQHYSTDKDGRYYFDKETVKQPSPGIVRAWSQLLYSPEGRNAYMTKRKNNGMATSGMEMLSHRNVLYELNCFSEEKEFCVLEVYEVDKNGKTVDYAKAGSYKDWSKIPPGSYLETLHSALCPKKKLK